MITDYRSERVDLRKLFSQIVNKLWIIIAATLVGAIIGVLAYVIYSNVMSGNTVYQIRNDYYIYLNYKDYDNSPDYYNAYTWDGILRDDPVVNAALNNAPGITKEEILNSVSGEILGDYRILTVIVRGTDADTVQTISDAYKAALPAFADIIDMIDHIDLWTDASIEEFDEYTREGNAAFLGGLIGLLLSLFSVLILVVTDNRIYTERDWKNRYADIPYLGIEGSEEYNLNKGYIIGDMELKEITDIDKISSDNKEEADNKDDYILLDVSKFSYSFNLMCSLRGSRGVVIRLIPGESDGELIDKVINTLIKQDVKVAAVSFATK